MSLEAISTVYWLLSRITILLLCLLQMDNNTHMN